MKCDEYLQKTLPRMPVDRETIRFVESNLINASRLAYKPATILTSTMYIPNSDHLLSRCMTLPPLQIPSIPFSFYTKYSELTVLSQKKSFRIAPIKNTIPSRNRLPKQKTESPATRRQPFFARDRGEEASTDSMARSSSLSSVSARAGGENMAKYFIRAKRQRGGVLNERLRMISSDINYQRCLAQQLSSRVPTLPGLGKGSGKGKAAAKKRDAAPDGMFGRKNRGIDQLERDLAERGHKAMECCGFQRVDRDWDAMIKQKEKQPDEYYFPLMMYARLVSRQECYKSILKECAAENGTKSPGPGKAPAAKMATITRERGKGLAEAKEALVKLRTKYQESYAYN